jgi:Peptidase M50B-like
VLFFQVIDEDAGRTVSEAKGWGPARILMTFAGYVTPPLLGLGGAALFDAGQILPLLWTAAGLLVLTLLKAEREWTAFVVLLLAAVTGYVALYGTPVLQVGFAAGLVWLLLFGGVRDTATAGRQKGTDPHHLFRDTLIPGMLWKAGFIAVAIVCLWKGAELMVP